MIGAALSALPQRLLAEAVGLMVEVALVAGVSYHYTSAYYEARIQREHDAQAAVAAAAAASSATETARRVNAQQEIAYAAQTQAARATADAAAAGRARDALRVQLASYIHSRSGSADTPASSGSAPAGDPIGLLGRMFSESDERAGTLASALDASRTAGSACERSYDALIPVR